MTTIRAYPFEYVVGGCAMVGLVLAAATGTLAFAVAAVAGVGGGALTLIYAASFLPVALILLWRRPASRN